MLNSHQIYRSEYIYIYIVFSSWKSHQANHIDMYIYICICNMFAVVKSCYTINITTISPVWWMDLFFQLFQPRSKRNATRNLRNFPTRCKVAIKLPMKPWWNVDHGGRIFFGDGIRVIPLTRIFLKKSADEFWVDISERFAGCQVSRALYGSLLLSWVGRKGSRLFVFNSSFCLIATIYWIILFIVLIFWTHLLIIDHLVG